MNPADRVWARLFRSAPRRGTGPVPSAAVDGTGLDGAPAAGRPA
jgi:hypothetical protein